MGDTAGGESTTEPAWRAALKDADRDALLRELLDSTDTDKLRKDPKLAGLIGDAAERRAKAKEAELREKILADAERERLRKLRDDDPYAYAEEEKKREQEAERKAQETRTETERVQSWASDIDKAIAEFAKSTLPAELNEKLAKKEYTGSYADGLKAYVADVIDASKEGWIAEARKQWEKDILPALRKDALAQVNGGDSADVGRGAAPAGALTQDEWARNYRDSAWRRANRDRINEALASNRIRPT